MSLYDKIKGKSAEELLEMAGQYYDEQAALEKVRKELSQEELAKDRALNYCRAGGKHEFKFLRMVVVTSLPNGVDKHDTSEHKTDIFYCTKCLAKREVPA